LGDQSARRGQGRVVLCPLGRRFQPSDQEGVGCRRVGDQQVGLDLLDPDELVGVGLGPARE
jgi:hypothetical protein